MGNMIIGQSGGPTCVINSSLCGAIYEAKRQGKINKIYGMVNGIEGMLGEKIFSLDEMFKDDADLMQLKNTPSSFLGSCRFKLPVVEKGNEVFENIFKIIKKYDIRYFFYIGGNDSMDTVDKLSKYAKFIDYDINIIGIPKTIDNDLVGTDHTPGYGSAAKYVASSIMEVVRDSNVYDLENVTVVESMGRNTGWLAASSVLAKNDANSSPVCVDCPEIPFSKKGFIEDVREVLKEKKAVIVAISEGIKDENGDYIYKGTTKRKDSFGHAILGGSGKTLESLVTNELGIKARAIELNVLQRCANHIASKTDIEEAFGVGKAAVESAINGDTGKLMGYIRSEGDYQITYEALDISKIANKEKTIPREWINEKGNNLNEKFIAYAMPLIQGEPERVFKDGLPVHIALDKKNYKLKYTR